MYPHERSLVQELEGKPFVLLGVNSDADRDGLRPRLQQERITWRSFWNGPKGARGPIATAWQVTSWPAFFVIDAGGEAQMGRRSGANRRIAPCSPGWTSR